MFPYRCFLSAPWPVLGGVGIPMSIMLVFNIIVYIRVILKLNKSVPGKTLSEEHAKRERWKRFQHAVVIFLLLGLTWGLGYVCFIPAGSIPSFIFQMLFVTFNSMHGYLIFMLYCMRNPIFRKRWRKICFFCPDRPLTPMTFRKNPTGTKKKYNLPSSKPFHPSSVPVSSVENRRFN